jgi:uncharacterized RDD family membrane protein YckC
MSSPAPRYAGFWIRFLADIIDTLVLTLVSWIVEFIVLGAIYLVWGFILSRQGETIPGFFDAFNAYALQMVNIGMYFCVAFPYYVWGHFRWGTTLGKKPFGIYVVDAKTLGPVTLKQSIGRFAAYGVSYALVATGFLMAAFHPRKQGLHDLMAGTVSVRREGWG